MEGGPAQPEGQGTRPVAALELDGGAPVPSSPAKRPRCEVGSSGGGGVSSSASPSGLTPQTELLAVQHIPPQSTAAAPSAAPASTHGEVGLELVLVPAQLEGASEPSRTVAVAARAGGGAAAAETAATGTAPLTSSSSVGATSPPDAGQGGILPAGTAGHPRRPSSLQLPSPVPRAPTLELTPSHVQGGGAMAAATAGFPEFLVPPARVPVTPRLRTPVTARPEQKLLADCVEAGDLPGATRLLDAETASTREAWVNALHSEDGEKFTMLMGAAALRTATVEVRTGLCRLLLSYGARPGDVDANGYTALHWAALDAGGAECIGLLLEAGANINHRSSSHGETPLHRASRLGAAPCVRKLIEAGADPWVRNHHYLTALDIAGQWAGRTTAKHRSAVRKLILSRVPAQRTAVLYHDDCLAHATAEYHQESPQRLTAIMAKIRNHRIFDEHEIDEVSDFPPATPEALTRAHTREYLLFLRALEEQVVDSQEAVPFTPHVQRSLAHFAAEEPKQADSSDTQFTPGSLVAAKRAAGAVVAAVDAVMARDYRNAFCCVRPPGHHAGPEGLVSDAVSCGFCLYNNVAVGALHALRERSDCRRIAIIDFDVHHGNGTQECVERLAQAARESPGQQIRDQLFFYSIHLYDTHRNCKPADISEVLEVSSSPREIEEATSSANALRRRPTATMDEVEWEFYPGTGAEDDVSAMVINSPLVPLWTPEITPLSRPGVHQPPATSRRRKSPKAGAGGGEGKSGGGGMEPPPTTELPARERRLPAHLQDTDAVTPTTPTAKPPHVAGSRGRHGFRSEVRRRLLPALRAFCPDLLMLSAGFDGANRDQGNVKLSDDSYPKGLDLRSEDFGWLTEQLVAVANICCNGRVVSVLEGGYGELQMKDSKWVYSREPLANNVAAHVRALVGKRK